MSHNDLTPWYLEEPIISVMMYEIYHDLFMIVLIVWYSYNKLMPRCSKDSVTILTWLIYHESIMIIQIVWGDNENERVTTLENNDVSMSKLQLTRPIIYHNNNCGI